jgi:hypothetical protein
MPPLNLPTLPTVPVQRNAASAAKGLVSVVRLDQYMDDATPANDEGPTAWHAVPASFVNDGPEPPVQPRMTASAVVALHSSFVGNRQSPADDPSVKPHAPLARPAAAWFAAAHAPMLLTKAGQAACFSQISPVTVSVTVPFPQSKYRAVELFR